LNTLRFASVRGTAAPAGLWARQQAILHPQGRTSTMPTARQSAAAANSQKRRHSSDKEESNSRTKPADVSNRLMALASAAASASQRQETPGSDDLNNVSGSALDTSIASSGLSNKSVATGPRDVLSIRIVLEDKPHRWKGLVQMPKKCSVTLGQFRLNVDAVVTCNWEVNDLVEQAFEMVPPNSSHAECFWLGLHNILKKSGTPLNEHTLFEGDGDYSLAVVKFGGASRKA